MTPMTRGVLGGALVVAMAATLTIAGAQRPGARTASAQTRPPAPPSSASCETCHAGIEPMHENVQLSCVECHGGDGTQSQQTGGRERRSM